MKVLTCLLAILSLQVPALAQTAYSIVDNNQDVTLRRQQLYRINVLSGDTQYIGDLVSPTGQRIIREYEGLASVGSALYGVAEFAGLGGTGTDCNTSDDPWTGLSSDVRQFRVFPEGEADPVTPSGAQQTVPTPGTPTPAQIALRNGQNTNAGPQIGETCINTTDGGTEAAASYNQQDGFIWNISSDDNFNPNNTRSRLYRTSPTTGLSQLMCRIVNADWETDGGDAFPYLDGMTTFSTGETYATEARFSVDPNPGDVDTRDFGGLYEITLPGSPVSEGAGDCEVEFIKHLFPVDVNQDTGLAHENQTLYILLEQGMIYSTGTGAGSGVVHVSSLSTHSGPATGAGGGDSNGVVAGGVVAGRIEGCRGANPGDPEFQNNIAPTIGACRDFEGFDIPVPAGR
ncbi:MAG TPA: hypothetical protein VJT15_18190 [Pyrinomonadaceae bacterium]|nr:hypothetical protein [Pyrinomonadaceae bacterium]